MADKVTQDDLAKAVSAFAREAAKLGIVPQGAKLRLERGDAARGDSYGLWLTLGNGSYHKVSGVDLAGVVSAREAWTHITVATRALAAANYVIAMREKKSS